MKPDFATSVLETISATRGTVVQLVNASKTGQIQPVEACASTSSVNSSEGFFQL